MKIIKQRIEEFNNSIKDLEDDFTMTVGKPDSDEKINELQQFCNLEIPKELQSFYKEIGSIGDNCSDCIFVLDIYSASDLLTWLKNEGKWTKLYSLGLIDSIKYSWGNNRIEFDVVKPEIIDLLNEKYKCIGLYRLDWICEEAYYIYFDKDQKFGYVRYHQDEYNELWEEHLEEMLEKSQANSSLEELITKILDQLKEGIQNW